MFGRTLPPEESGDTRRRRVEVALAALALALCLALPVARAGGLRAWALRSMAPDQPFDAAVPPAPPDYADPLVWSALPELTDLADQTPTGSPAAADPRADLFYVHPTSAVGADWNASATDPKIAVASDRGGVLIQASAFNRVAAIYAPRYRQANGTAFFAPSADGDRAIDLAYSDVDRAFTAFLARRDPRRPFLLAGHSQGAVMAARLLGRRISGTPLRDQLVAAWIVGSNLTRESLQRLAPDVPPCAHPSSVGCAMAWNARTPEVPADAIEMRYPPDEHRLCTNPLSGADDGVAMPASANLGAVFLQSGDPKPKPAFADATCERNTLVVRTLGKAPRDLPSRILDRVIGKGNLHPIEFELYYMNIRANAEERLAAWELSRGPQAPPDP